VPVACRSCVDIVQHSFCLIYLHILFIESFPSVALPYGISRSYLKAKIEVAHETTRPLLCDQFPSCRVTRGWHLTRDIGCHIILRVPPCLSSSSVSRPVLL
jgi:hypothetical protein